MLLNPLSGSLGMCKYIGKEIFLKFWYELIFGVILSFGVDPKFVAGYSIIFRRLSQVFMYSRKCIFLKKDTIKY